MNTEELGKIRTILVDKIYRNPEIMFNDTIRGENNENIDLVDVITDLYEYLHKEVTGEDYDYMFHWANKIGGDTETGYFKEVMKDESKASV